MTAAKAPAPSHGSLLRRKSSRFLGGTGSGSGIDDANNNNAPEANQKNSKKNGHNNNNPFPSSNLDAAPQRLTSHAPPQQQQQQQQQHSRESSRSSNSFSDLRDSFRRRRSTSSRSQSQSQSQSQSHRAASPAGPVNLAHLQSPEKRAAANGAAQGGAGAVRPTLTVSTLSARQRSSENVNSAGSKSARAQSSTSVGTDPRSARNLPFSQTLRKEDSARSATSASSYGLDVTPTSGGLPPTSGGSQNPNNAFQTIQDMCSKRISTLDYLRKTHEGRIYWFNTLHFKKTDLAKLPYFEPQKLARRATNHLLLGLSLPAILDPNSGNATDYLRAFSSLLTEFESYQSIHPPDGSSSSARNRIPQMFKRTPGVRSGGRRGSSADTLLPLGGGSSGDNADYRSTSGGASALFPSFPGSGDRELLAGEEYAFLLTPALPFDPDYFETFATLCDVLIDCYTKIVMLTSTPEQCSPPVGDLFHKVDGKIRKILIAGIVRDFEDSSKQGLRSEVSGVAKVVLGGLM